MKTHLIDPIHKLDPAVSGAQALLIRHAKREPILSADTVWDARLTDEGRLDAQSFGAALAPFSFGGAFASPIPRCMETAALILDGWGHPQKTVQSDWFLLNAYVRDKAAVKAQFEVHDSDQLVLDHVAGMPLDGFFSPQEGSKRLLREIAMRMAPDALTLFVSHDALLMPLYAHYFGARFSKATWFPCLHGAVISKSDSGICIDGALVTGRE